MKEKLLKYISTENIVSVLAFLFLYLIPVIKTEYGVMQFTFFAIMVLLSLSLTLIWGFTGIFSFGQAIFFGIGAYVYAVCSKIFEEPKMTPVYAVIAVVSAALVAAILGIFMFYGGINDVFVGLITLSVSLAIYTFMQTATGAGWMLHGKNGDFDLGGWTGMSSIARLQFGNLELSTIPYYLIIVTIILIVFVIFKKLQKSKLGYSMLAIRENRDRSALFGYNVPLIQTVVFSIGGALAALAGIFYVGNNNDITLERISITASTMPIVLVATAGRKNATGAIIFTLFFYYLDQTLAATGSQYSPIIIGVMLILVVIFLPEGLFSSFFRASDSFFSKLFAKKEGKEA